MSGRRGREERRQSNDGGDCVKNDPTVSPNVQLLSSAETDGYLL
jgi:hypothetical protein